jgi:predicted Zn-dependent protease
VSNDKRKSPFAGTTEGDEEDWEKALNAWEVPDEAAPKNEAKPTAQKAPLYHPPSPAAPTPVPPRLDDALAAFDSYDDDDADEATIVSRVSAELLAGAGAAPKAAGQGSGLGQVFRREDPKPTPAPPASDRGDALLDMLFEAPPGLNTDESVVTSAPHLHVDDRTSIPDEERKRGLEAPVDDVPEGSLFDPFAPARDERAATMRPGALPSEPAGLPLPPAPPPVPRIPAPRAMGGPAPFAPPRPGAPSRLPLTPEPAKPPAALPSAITARAPVPEASYNDEEDTTRAPAPPRVREAMAAVAAEQAEHADLADRADHSDSVPPDSIRLESVPPDSLPPPDAEPIVGRPVLGLGASPAAPDVHTLQGGHRLPAVATRAIPVPSAQVPAPIHAPPPGRDPFETLADESGPNLLNDPDELAAWQARATWLEEEARASVDRVVKARGLLVASELQALAGDGAHAQSLAGEARDLAPTHPLPHRQARAASMQEGDFNAVVQALQNESRSASTPAARAHGALLAAEIARIVHGDKDLSNKRLEQAIRALPSDPRGQVTRLATALGESDSVPKIRWPEEAELAPLVEATQTLARWRGAAEKGQFANAVDALLRVRAALRGRDPLGTIQALEALGDATGLSEATGWLAAAIALVFPSADTAIVQRLERLAHGTLPRIARRALAAFALEKGDAVAVMSSLNQSPEETFTSRDRAVIAALVGAEAPSLEKWLEPLDRDREWGMLASAIRSALGAPRAVIDEPSEAHVGTRLANPDLRLARLLAAKAPSADLTQAIVALEETTPGRPIAQVLATEIDMETGRVDRLADTLSKQGGESEMDKRDRALMVGLLYEVAGQTLRARELYTAARSADPSCEAAVRAEIFVSPPSETANLLSLYEASLDDARKSALIVLEAAHNTGEDPESYSRLLKEAHAKAPSLPFAAWLAERRARARGEFDNIVEWLRERRRSSDDSVEQAYDLVREALLIADRDLDEARELLEQASRARPGDLALRELYERLSSEPPADKAAFWSERALAAQGTDRARLTLLAAMEQERAGNFEQAARLAQASLEAEDAPLTRLCAERNETKGGFAANLAERLIEQARSTEDAQARVETYERLADLDEFSRGDASSAVLWHQSILEERPGYLPSVSRLEQWLIGEGRENDLEPIAGAAAKALTGTEAMAHAHVAARLRTRAGPWQGGLDFVRIAFSQDEPPLWSLREMEAHAALAGDAPTQLLAAHRLLEHTDRPLEIATLALRGADAAIRAGETETAKDLLVRATHAHPTHLIVQRMLAELCEQIGDHVGSAEAWEAVATLSGVPEHQLDANHRASVLWLDLVKDTARGRATLEAAAQIDITHHDVFTRLQALYIALGEREALASLLEARLASVRDPNERIELEIIRGKTLAEIGDAAAAKRALAFALESSPDHADALRAFAEICAREEDWSGAEQALIRLVRLLPDPTEQAAIYMRLGELYDQHQPNPERAELAYREVLRRMPTDVAARERLVDVYRRVGDGPKAIDMQHALLAAADSPETKRKRTIELARVYDEVAHDPKKAEALLEQARKEFPNDVELLTAVVAFYRRSNRLPAVQVLLDRAAGDARRALSTGRFDVNLFSMLGAVARLRDRAAAASIAEATVAAIEGRTSNLLGAGARAADPRLDDQLAPELLTAAFRALLRKSGEILDAAVSVDFRALRAVPLPAQASPAAAEIRDLGAAFGLPNLEVFVSQQLGSVCMPVGSNPPQIVIGQPLLASNDEEVRRFLVVRALKIVQARASALARSAPIDLLPLVSGYLLLFAPDWQPAAVDAGKLRDMHAKLAKWKPARLDDDVGVLALEVIGSLGNRASTLHTVVNGWGNRVALLASGDLSTALTAIARAAGHSSGPAASGPERATWIGRNAEARDLAVFSVSDAYADVRAKLGV